MKTSATQLALGGVFAALGVVILCLGGIVPLALYICPILASLTLLPVRARCSGRVAWCCFAAIAVLGLLLSPDKESASVFACLGFYPLVKPRFDKIRAKPRRGLCKLLFAAFCGGTDYALLIFVFRLEALTRELRETAPWLLGLTVLMGLALFLLYDAILTRLPHRFPRVAPKHP